MYTFTRDFKKPTMQKFRQKTQICNMNQQLQEKKKNQKTGIDKRRYSHRYMLQLVFLVSKAVPASVTFGTFP